jgi:putative hemolysin
MGRLCVAPGAPHGADALRVAWGAVAALVDAAGVRLLFGCASFPGTDPEPHRAAFAHLARHHAAPAAWAPGRRARETVDLAGPVPDRVAALRAMPPLLRAYLALGGWTGDHAVIDRDLGTLHVLVAVETARVPPRPRPRAAAPRRPS